MATIIRRDTIRWNFDNIVKSIYDYISQYDDRWDKDETNQILYANDVFGVKFAQSSNRPTMSLICGDSSHTEITVSDGLRPNSSDWNTANMFVRYIKSNNLTWIELIHPNSTSDVLTIGILWITTGNEKNYVRLDRYHNAIDFNNSSSNDKIGPYNVANANREMIYISPNIRFDVNIPGKIVYSNKCLAITTDGGSVTTIPGCTSCSNVVRDSTITALGRNRYAVGTNTLLTL